MRDRAEQEVGRYQLRKPFPVVTRDNDEEAPVVETAIAACRILLALHHELGHRSLASLLDAASDRYEIPELEQIAQAVVTNCITCQLTAEDRKVWTSCSYRQLRPATRSC